MADMKDGFSVSFKTGADMLTVQGIDYETFKKNLADLFDDEEIHPQLARFISGDTAQRNVASVFGSADAAPPAVSNAGTSDPVASPSGNDTSDGEHEYEVCNKPTASGPCGQLQNEWKPGGKRANGTTYSGFWGCPNWKAHLKGRK